MQESEAACREAMQIRRDLAALDPGAYRPALATTLSVFGMVYISMQRPAEARNLLEEALSIYQDLATASPAIYAGKIEQLNKLIPQTDALTRATKP